MPWRRIMAAVEGAAASPVAGTAAAAAAASPVAGTAAAAAAASPAVGAGGAAAVVAGAANTVAVDKAKIERLRNGPYVIANKRAARWAVVKPAAVRPAAEAMARIQERA